MVRQKLDKVWSSADGGGAGEIKKLMKILLLQDADIRTHKIIFSVQGCKCRKLLKVNEKTVKCPNVSSGNNGFSVLNAEQHESDSSRGIVFLEDVRPAAASAKLQLPSTVLLDAIKIKKAKKKEETARKSKKGKTIERHRNDGSGKNATSRIWMKSSSSSLFNRRRRCKRCW